MNGVYKNGTKSVCVDCETPYIRKYKNHTVCDSCYILHKEYSRPCTKCSDGLIFPNQEDDVILCISCSVNDQGSSRYMCVTSGCPNETGEKWKTFCVGCYIKQQSITKDTDSNSPTAAMTSRGSGKMTTSKTSIYKCTECNNSVDASWKKLCGRCFAKSKTMK
jgi:hypothetical protein